MTEAYIERDVDGKPVEDVLSVEITADATALVEQFDQLRAVLRTTVAALAEAVIPAMRALAEAAAAAQQADQSQYALAPGRPRPTARPAWQSPYGPPPPRARHGRWVADPGLGRSRHHRRDVKQRPRRSGAPTT